MTKGKMGNRIQLRERKSELWLESYLKKEDPQIRLPPKARRHTYSAAVMDRPGVAKGRPQPQVHPPYTFCRQSGMDE